MKSDYNMYSDFFRKIFYKYSQISYIYGKIESSFYFGEKYEYI